MSAPELFHDGRVALYPGDCLATLDALPDNSVDSVVCDPPYHLTSIVRRFGGEGAAPAKEGKTGAYARASKGFMSKTWDGGDIAFQVETWAKVLRVLKPGGYILAFSSSRTFGRMSVAIEDAGFITHPMIGWLFASGFPKATRIKAEGYEGQRYGAQSLKPALEPIYMGQKPFSEATGTANILRWGTGAVRIDDCRVPMSSDDSETINKATFYNSPASVALGTFASESSDKPMRAHSLGRWPANLCHDGSPEVLAAFPETTTNPGTLKNAAKRGTYSPSRQAETELSRGDSGSAARFFFQAKADADDRLNSRHPTVKPLDLMRWLVRLVTQKSGIVLDPFAGTGSTAHAALIEGCRIILCEREAEYCDDIRRRMGLVYSGRDERARRLATTADDHGPLFAGAAE